ncbi:MAG: 4Fe-4S binding protein [Proteobacteria bacterium]|nr:4Fe-4S binding protein [Pseudomonadota bacterium]
MTAPSPCPPRGEGDRETRAEAARQAALAVLADVRPAEPQTLVYPFRGTLLLVDPERRLLGEMGRLASELRVVAVVGGRRGEVSGPAGLRLIRGRVIGLSGHLGAFRAEAAGRDGPVDLGPFSPGGEGAFDIVIDAAADPLLTSEVLPFGYYRAGPDDDVVARVRADLPGFRAGLEKPRYVRYRDDICVHARQGVEGCGNCLSVCPAGALGSAGGRIEVNYHLCQGCASCAAVCPTGALVSTFPGPGAIREAVRASLVAYREAGAADPVILFHEPGERAEPGGPGTSVVPVAVRSLAAVGIETWLAALAWGAAEVWLGPSSSMPATARAAVEGQARIARELLERLGDEAGRVRLVAPDDGPPAAGPGPRPQATAAAGFAALDDKRPTLMFALDHLALRGEPRGEAPELAAGAPLGEIVVDRAACTMCLACARLCPTGAIQAGARETELLFTEEACVQCGLCARGCPERAIALRPRLLVAGEERRRARPLNALGEEAMARCAECGRPFLPRAMLESIARRLGERTDFGKEALRRLYTCPECRSRTTLDAMTIVRPRGADGSRRP